MSVLTFSLDSAEYSRSRPQYPKELFSWLAAQCKDRILAWDCATGNGQSAIGLVDYFDKVYASDISEEQIKNAFRHERVVYFVESVEATHFENNSFDLIVAAQSLHWFDFSNYWKEVQRVAKPNAFYSAWGYDWAYSVPLLDELLIRPFRKVLEPFWNVRNSVLWRGYTVEDTHFPFEKVNMPEFVIDQRWTVENLISYFQTWSAYKMANVGAKSQLQVIVSRTYEKFSPDEIVPVVMPLKSICGVIR